MAWHTCLNCGIRFHRGGTKARYCSHSCFAQASRRPINTICQYCGKGFDAERKAMKYCSNGCRYLAAHKGSILTCLYCGKQVYRSPARIERGEQYCSRKCQIAATPTIDKVCPICGKQFTVLATIANRYSVCSRGCRFARGTHSLNFIRRPGSKTGPASPKFKPKISIICDYCGCMFNTYPCRAKDGRRKYCCKQHRHLGNLKRLASVQRTDIEIAMASALDNASIPYQEQAVMFGKFMVDFLLSTSHIIVQCDGIYWHDRPGTRARDRGQDAYLAKCGYLVLRFTDKDITSNLTGCIECVRLAAIPRHFTSPIAK